MISYFRTIQSRRNLQFYSQILTIFLLSIFIPGVVNSQSKVLKIVWSSSSTGNRDIWIMNPDGSGKKPLTTWSSDEGSPTISPDGTKIAFVSNQTGTYQIWAMTLDGSPPQHLPTGGQSETPAWSSDGTKIYFTKKSATWSDIWVMDADGNNQHLVIQNAAYPALSPDGTKIAYYKEPGPNANNYNLYIANVNGTSEVNLSAAVGLTGYEAPTSPAAWGSNGRILITAQEPSWHNTLDYDIYWVAANGSGYGAVLNETDKENAGAGWSPDLTQIVFRSKRSGNIDIWIMNADGSNLRQLTDSTNSDESPVMGLVHEMGSITTTMTFVPYYPSGDYINSEVMKGGKAFRWYKILDQNGYPIALRSFRYRYNGGGKVWTGHTDEYGFVKIETDWLSEGIHLTLEVLNQDNSVKSDVFDPPSYYVDVKDRQFNQEWSLLFGTKGSVSKTFPKFKFGPVKFRTVEAGIGLGRSTKGTINYENKGNETTLLMSNEIDLSAELFASAGLFGKTWISTKSRPELKVGLEGSIEGKLRIGSSFKFEEFLDEEKEDHETQALIAGTFLLETALSALEQIPVGSVEILSHLTAKILNRINNLSKYHDGNTMGVGIGGSFGGGGSINLKNPFGKPTGSIWGVSLLDFNLEGLLMVTQEEKMDNSRSYSLGLSAEFDFTPLGIGFTQKFGGDKRRNDTPKFNLGISFFELAFEGEASISVEKKNNEIQRIYLDASASSSNEYLLYSDVTENKFHLEVKNSLTIDEIGQRLNIFKGIVEENGISLNPNFYFDAFLNAFDLMDIFEEWRHEREEKRLIELGFDFEIGAGIGFGLGVQLVGLESLGFSTKVGKISSQKGMMDLQEYRLDSEIEQKKKTLTSFFNVIGQILKNELKDFINTAFAPIANGVQQLGGKIEGAISEVTGHLSVLLPSQLSTRILALPGGAPKDLSLSDALAAATIGNIYIVNLTSTSGTPITDFSASPITITIEYTDQMLIDAGLDPSKSNKLSIYRWDGEMGYYIFQASTVDLVNKKVSALITRPGQYLLAIDESPPTITEFKVSNNTSNPIVSARIQDTLSGIDLNSFLLTLDGTTKVDGSNVLDYYDPLSGIFAYPVTSALAGGSHTANLSVRNTGQILSTGQLTFTVNQSVPQITHTPLANAASGADINLTATITDDTGVSRALLFYQPNNDAFYFQSIPLVKGTGNDYSVVIDKSKVTSLGLRYYLTAEDSDGNLTSTPQYTINVTDTTPPGKPVGLKVGPRNQALLFKWDPVVDADVAGYKIYSGDAPGNLSLIQDAGLNTSSILTGLTNGHTYYLAVSAYDYGNREGSLSDAIAGTPVYMTAPRIVPSPTYLEGFSISSTSKSVVLTNNGNADLIIGDVAFADEHAGDFARNSNCATVIPENSCSITVHFVPQGNGLRRASLLVSSNDPDVPQLEIPLEGNIQKIYLPLILR